jgi:hypothetical protein
VSPELEVPIYLSHGDPISRRSHATALIPMLRHIGMAARIGEDDGHRLVVTVAVGQFVRAAIADASQGIDVEFGPA